MISPTPEAANSLQKHEWAQKVAALLDGYLFSKSPRLRKVGIRLFVFNRGVLYFFSSPYGLHVLGILTLFSLLFTLGPLLIALQNRVVGDLESETQVLGVKRDFLRFVLAFSLLVTLEYINLVLMYVPSIRDEIISQLGEVGLEYARNHLPFRQRIFPQLAVLVPLLSFPFPLAYGGYSIVEIAKAKLKTALTKKEATIVNEIIAADDFRRGNPGEKESSRVTFVSAAAGMGARALLKEIAKFLPESG